MKVIKPNEIDITTDGSFSRNSTGTYWDSDKVLKIAAINEPRFNYNPATSEFEGILIEPASTNLLLNSETLSSQTVTLTPGQTYSLSFYNTGTIQLSGAYSGTVTGAALFERKVLTFQAASASLTLTVTGTVKYAQLEPGTRVTSYIPTTNSPASRSADIITGTGLIYTTVTDPNPVWSSNTTYSVGQKVRYSGRVWESLQSNNLNKQPNTNPTWWLEISPDNQHAALDTSISTASSATTSMTFVLKIGKINAAALINVECATARIALTDPTEGNVYSSIYGLSGASIYDWYQYFFNDPLVKRNQIVFYNIPTYENSVITIRLDTSTGDTVSLSQAVFGTLNSIGMTQYGVKAGITDYSIKETDQYGLTTFVERAYSKRMNVQVMLANNQLNRVYDFLTSIRAKPSVWIASDDPTYEEALIVFGYYRDFNVEISYPAHSVVDLEIEGLT